MSAVRQIEPRARLLNVTEREYFADPCEVPSLSQSIAHVLVSESPLHAWQRHPRLGGSEDEGTSATSDGKLVHKLLLKNGEEDIVLIPFDEYRTNAAKEMRDNALALGKLPVKHRDYEKALVAVEAIRSNLANEGVTFDGGQSEVSFEWIEDTEHGPVVCRGRMDHIKTDRGQIIDVKKIVSAHPRQVGRHMYDYGYDIQYTAYTRCLAKYKPELAGRVQMLFAFVEFEAPYAVLVAEPDGTLRNLGEERWNRAVNVWERCLRTNKWPAYSRGRPVTVEAPAWAINQEMGDQHADW